MSDIIDTTAVKVIDKRGDYAEQETSLQAQDNSPASMMMAAISKGMDLDKLEKFMQLQENWEANEAKKAYYKAMALFSQNAPEIVKDRQVSFGAGKASYTHASLANVSNSIRAELGKYGLSPKWITVQNEGIITVTCTITHELGFSESTSLSAAPDTSGNKNSIQAVGSTITYLERYTLLALTGLATKDMDDDGNGSSSQPDKITEAQVNEIKKIIEDKNIDIVPFFKWAKVTKIEDITAKAFKEVMDKLKSATGRPKTKVCAEKDGKEVPITECEKCEAKKAGMCSSWS
jgi:hypothetical protein